MLDPSNYLFMQDNRSTSIIHNKNNAELNREVIRAKSRTPGGKRSLPLVVRKKYRNLATSNLNKETQDLMFSSESSKQISRLKNDLISAASSDTGIFSH